MASLGIMETVKWEELFEALPVEMTEEGEVKRR